MVKRTCVICGNAFVVRENGKGNFYRKTCSEECHSKLRSIVDREAWNVERRKHMSEMFTGRDTTGWKIPQDEERSNWKGGYTSRYFNKMAFERFGLSKVCMCCGSTKQICVHHRDRNRTNNTIENLVILCKSCHTRHHNNMKEVGVNSPNGYNNQVKT